MTLYSPKSSSFVGMILLAGALSAHADVRYTTQMTMGGAEAPSDAQAMPEGMAMPAIRTTTYVKDMHERVETSMHMGPIKMDTVTLTLCDKHQSIKMDPSLKIYTVGPIGALALGFPTQARPGSPDMRMSGGKPGVGTVTTTVTAQDLGRESVAGRDAHHFKVTMRMQSEGCIGKDDNTFAMEEWVAPLKGGLVCPERYAPTRITTNERGCKITYAIKGDLSTFKEIGAGMIVRMIMYGSGKDAKPVAEQNLRAYSTALLDASLFAPPIDYKEVTAADFEKQQGDAMRKSMIGGMGDMFKPPADDSGSQGSDSTPPGGDANPPADSSGDKTPPPAPKKHPKFKLPRLPF